MAQRSDLVVTGLAAALALCACGAEGNSAAAGSGVAAATEPPPRAVAAGVQPPGRAAVTQPSAKAAVAPPSAAATRSSYSSGFALEGVQLGMKGEAVRAALAEHGYAAGKSSWSTETDAPAQAEDAAGKRLTIEYAVAGAKDDTVDEVGLRYEPVAVDEPGQMAAAQALYDDYVSLYGEPDVCRPGERRQQTWENGVCSWTQFVGGAEETLRWTLQGFGETTLRLRSEPGLVPVNGPEQVAGPASPFAVETVGPGMTRNQIRVSLEQAGYVDTFVRDDRAGTEAHHYGTFFERENPDGTMNNILIKYDENHAAVPRAVEVHAELARPDIAYASWKTMLAKRYGAPDRCSDAGAEPDGDIAAAARAAGGSVRIIYNCEWTAQAGGASDRLSAKLHADHDALDVYRRSAD